MIPPMQAAELLILVRGSIPGSRGEILIGEEFASSLEVGPGDKVTLMGPTMMMPGKFHAEVVPGAYYIGFVPGLFSSTLGTMLSGIGIYRRQTATLFKGMLKTGDGTEFIVQDDELGLTGS